jgi:hypothetical protein
MTRRRAAGSVDSIRISSDSSPTGSWRPASAEILTERGVVMSALSPVIGAGLDEGRASQSMPLDLSRNDRAVRYPFRIVHERSNRSFPTVSSVSFHRA